MYKSSDMFQGKLSGKDYLLRPNQHHAIHSTWDRHNLVFCTALLLE